jgi:hypothetical protein
MSIINWCERQCIYLNIFLITQKIFFQGFYEKGPFSKKSQNNHLPCKISLTLSKNTYIGWTLDFETPACKLYLLFISAKSAKDKEQKRKKHCCLLVF